MLATQIEVSDGTLHTVNVGIAFFVQTDISVSLDQSAPLTLGVDYQWANATTVEFLPTDSAPGGFIPTGIEVIIRRDTKNDEMYNILDGGAPFSRLTLDENYRQLLFLSQEFSEGLGLDGLRNNLNMNGYKVVNVGTPVTEGDATNKAYVDSLIEATNLMTQTLNSKTLRLPEDVLALPNAATRANKLLGFDSTGAPVISAPASGSAADLTIALASPRGASLIGKVPSGTVQDALSSIDATLRADLALPSGVGLVSGGDFSEGTVTSSLFAGVGNTSIEALFLRSLRLDQVASLSPNNPAANDAALLSAILTVAGINNIPVDGGGATFYGNTSLIVHPNQVARSFKYQLVGPGASSAATPRSHVPAISLTGISTARAVFIDVTADGGRSGWPNISMSTAGPEGGGSEDGGMHAWRITGDARDCLWVRCKGQNAATAGWAIHNPLPSSAVLQYQKRNLTFYDCDGTGNREHGMFADSFDGIRWIGGSLTGNGLDLNTTDPLVHGNRGARDTNGKLFGMPFDLEAYGPTFIGSMFKNFLMQSVDCRGNAIMATIYNPIPSDTAGYASSVNIRLIDCDLDAGTALLADRPADTAGLALNVSGNLVSTPPFNGMQIHCRMSGRPAFNGVSKLDMGSGFIEALSPKAIINNCSFFDVSCASLVGLITVFPAIPVIITKTSGAAGATFVTTLSGTRGALGCAVQQVYSVSITGATAAGGPVVATVSPPAGYLVRTLDLNVVVTATSKPVTSSSRVLGVGGSASISIDASNDTNLTATFIVELEQSL